MPERGKPSGKLDLTPDAAAPPPGEPPDTVPIYGILGESPLASNVRLYLDVNHSTYYDIPIEGIVGREKVPAASSPLHVDSTLLFVRKGIRLVAHHADSRTVEQEFLSGDFTAPGSFVPTASVIGAGATNVQPDALPHPSFGFTCTYVAPECPQGLGGHVLSAPPDCPSVQACHTRPQFGCPRPPISRMPCPSVQACHTQPNFGCPPLLSARDACPSVHCETAHFTCPPLSAPPRCPTVHNCGSRVIC